jgi:hypothetical protein
MLSLFKRFGRRVFQNRTSSSCKTLAATRQEINLTLLDKYTKKITLLKIVSILIFCISCQDQKTKTKDDNSLSVSIQDTVATISFPNLLSLDTNYTWVDHNDTDCSSIRKIRYQNKKDSSFQETGFINLSLPPKFMTYVTFKTKEHIKCINRINPQNFNNESVKFKRSTQFNEHFNEINSKKLIDLSFINSNKVQLYITGNFLKIKQNEINII